MSIEHLDGDVGPRARVTGLAARVDPILITAGGADPAQGREMIQHLFA